MSQSEEQSRSRRRLPSPQDHVCSRLSHAPAGHRGTGDDWRLHSAYDLRAGRRGLVSITDRHGGEKLSYYHLQAGDIVIADRGYGFRCSVALASQQHAYVVLRFVLKSFPVEDEHGLVPPPETATLDRASKSQKIIH